MNETADIKFEMTHEEIDALIDGIKRKEVVLNSHDVARIHAHVSPNGENCKECHKKVVEAGIITDFNEELDDKE